MLSLPSPPATANERALADWKSEEYTGLVTAVITLTRNVDVASGMVWVWKNGTMVRPSLVSVAGNRVTLPGALIAGDWVVVIFKSRN